MLVVRTCTCHERLEFLSQHNGRAIEWHSGRVSCQQDHTILYTSVTMASAVLCAHLNWITRCPSLSRSASTKRLLFLASSVRESECLCFFPCGAAARRLLSRRFEEEQRGRARGAPAARGMSTPRISEERSSAPDRVDGGSAAAMGPGVLSGAFASAP